MTNWHQTSIKLKAQNRGFHLITNEIIDSIPELEKFTYGLAHLFIQHTSASLTINENADPDVRTDFESHLNHIIPENAPYYVHTCEGPDDMPAHLKSSILGNNLTIPITNGKLNLGLWQGIYLCEHRNIAHRRNIIITLNGDKE
jgi:secondary thiamine-phosphate synthase enzyme